MGQRNSFPPYLQKTMASQKPGKSVASFEQAVIKIRDFGILARDMGF
jgi:hypothetical protein